MADRHTLYQGRPSLAAALGVATFGFVCLGALVRINPENAEIRIVGRVVRRGPLAFVGNDLYRGCEHKAGHLGLRRLAGIVRRGE